MGDRMPRQIFQGGVIQIVSLCCDDILTGQVNAADTFVIGGQDHGYISVQIGRERMIIPRNALNLFIAG